MQLSTKRKLSSVTWYQSYKSVLFTVWSFREVKWRSTWLNKVRERFYIIHFNLYMFSEVFGQLCWKRLLPARCMYRLLLSSLAARYRHATVFIFIKPKVLCTSAVSDVLLLPSAQKITRPIRPFRDQGDRRPTWLLAFTTLRPLRASRSNCWYKYGGSVPNHRPDTSRS